jgi:hypothetical protein
MAGSTEFKTINTKLTASPGGLDAGLKQAEDKFRSFASRVQKMFSGGAGGGLGGLLGGIGGGGVGQAAVAGFEGIKQGFEEILHQGEKALALEKQARSVGFSGAGLSAFDRLKPGGAEVMQPLLVKLNKTVGEAALGSEEAAKKLKLIGVSVDEVVGKTPEQVYERIADAIAKIPGKAERTAAAIEVLGKSGAEALPLLEKGGGAFQAARLKQNERGVAPPEDLVKATEAYHRASANLDQAWEGAKNRAANAFAPVIEKGAGFLNNVASIIDDFGSVVDLLPPELGGSGGQGKTLGNRGDAANKKGFDAQKKAAEDAKNAAAADKKRRDNDLFAEIDKEVAAGKKLNNAFGLTPEQAKFAETVDRLKAAGLDKTAKGMQEIADAAQNVQTATDNINLKRITESLETPGDKFNKGFGQLQDLFGRGKLSGDQFARGGLKDFEGLEQSLGLGKTNPVITNVAAGLDPTTAAGASALLQATNQSGGDVKTIQERIAAAQDKVKELIDTGNRDASDFYEWVRSNGLVIQPGNAS